MILKQLFLKSPTLLKAVTVMNQKLEGYTSRFWKNIFRSKYIGIVQSVQKLPCLPLSCYFGETLLFCQHGRGQRGKRHFKLEHPKQKGVELKEEGKMKNTQKKKISGSYEGHRVGILTFSKKDQQNPHPRAKNNCQNQQKQIVYFSSTL